ncbi:MAG: hypothetical protein HZC02_03680 [Candidatus Levybacteria bacterium]|nr:hypothetical protein [Candidatus Levybacteria bacterium]
MAETKPEFVQAPFRIVEPPSIEDPLPTAVPPSADILAGRVFSSEDQARLTELEEKVERLSNQGQPTIDIQNEIARIRGIEMPSIKRKEGPFLEDIMSREQIEENLRNNLPASFSPPHIRTGQEARGDRSPTWRGPRQRAVSKRTK